MYTISIVFFSHILIIQTMITKIIDTINSDQTQEAMTPTKQNNSYFKKCYERVYFFGLTFVPLFWYILVWEKKNVIQHVYLTCNNDTFAEKAPIASNTPSNKFGQEGEWRLRIKHLYVFIISSVLFYIGIISMLFFLLSYFTIM